MIMRAHHAKSLPDLFHNRSNPQVQNLDTKLGSMTMTELDNDPRRTEIKQVTPTVQGVDNKLEGMAITVTEVG